MIENGKKVIENVKGRRKINQKLRERQIRAAESFAPPRIEISRIEPACGALNRKKEATLSPIEIRTPRAALQSSFRLARLPHLAFFTFSYTKYTKRKYCNRQKIRTRDFDESPRFRPP
ncbi:hypothetical protein AVEN_135348-1 [Araneus ventricosus]|uniref:Uncharacterized protein n=1 Tax=Araneus ventricosus TaxID=182803 RepID=A0A4Y2L0L7_ARAVE|nr:hypothetical protein AVEN_135348-1 [Araneus ventricosus]